MTCKPHNSGFTLLELLISMTILSMIVVIMFGGFRIGIRAWEKGEKDVGFRQKQRIVLDLIKHQLVSICVAEVRDRDGRKVRFRGDPGSMAFVSHLPLTPGGLTGLTFVQYTVGHDAGDDTACLTFYERPLAYPGRSAGALEPDYAELLCGVENMAFEYLKARPKKQESPWQASWDPETEKGTPRAIRIMLQEKKGESPVYVIAAAGS